MATFLWPNEKDDAIKEQLALRDLVKLTTVFPTSLSFDHGLAIGTSYEENTKTAFSVGIKFDGNGELVGRPRTASIEVDFPYVPGMLAFRVGPAICRLIDELHMLPDLLLFDGQGIAHPRQFGLACHIGVLYDCPSIGVTRNPLHGRFMPPPRGQLVATEVVATDSDEVIGHVFCISTDHDPCYVSPGHKISAADALRVVRRITHQSDTWAPGPIAKAHVAANAAVPRHWKIQKKLFSKELKP